MKRDILFVSSAALVYSYLFYKQAAGVNFLIFSGIIIGLQLLRNTEIRKTRTWQMAAIGCILSSVGILLYGNGLSVTANIISLLTLGFTSYSGRNSIPIGLFHSLFSVLGAFVFLVIDLCSPPSSHEENVKSKWSLSKVLFYLVIPGAVFLIFFGLYRQGNNIFQELTKNIDLSFISINWLFFLCFGFILMYGLFRHRVIRVFQAFDEGAKNKLIPNELPSSFDKLLDPLIEFKSGIVLFALLNLLLIVVNIGDGLFIVGVAELLPGMSLSDSVHQGVGALITSVVFAVLIILYYFRGRLNFFQNNGKMKSLAVFWITQNLFLIFCTAYRNYEYVFAHGLTYKRIGVYVYLVLTVIGLVFTLFKVLKMKSNWYLVRAVSWSFFVVLVVSPLINWDRIVLNSQLQIASTQSQPIDINYLHKLSSECYPVLYNIILDEYDDNELNKVERKLGQYLWSIENCDWRSYSTRGSNVRQFIDNKFSKSQQEMLKEKGASWFF